MLKLNKVEDVVGDVISNISHYGFAHVDSSEVLLFSLIKCWSPFWNLTSHKLKSILRTELIGTSK